MSRRPESAQSIEPEDNDAQLDAYWENAHDYTGFLSPFIGTLLGGITYSIGGMLNGYGLSLALFEMGLLGGVLAGGMVFCLAGLMALGGGGDEQGKGHRQEDQKAVFAMILFGLVCFCIFNPAAGELLNTSMDWAYGDAYQHAALFNIEGAAVVLAGVLLAVGAYFAINALKKNSNDTPSQASAQALFGSTPTKTGTDKAAAPTTEGADKTDQSSLAASASEFH